MKKNPDAIIARAVYLEVGILDGALNVIIMRIQHVSLAVDDPEETHRISVLLLDRDQAEELEQQLADALGGFGSNLPRTGH